MPPGALAEVARFLDHAFRSFCMGPDTRAKLDSLRNTVRLAAA
jgi:hypothetical protein